MIKVYIMVGVGLALLIGGIISAKISFAKGKGLIAILSTIICIVGIFTTYMGYDTFMIQPREFSITEIREESTGYRLTVASKLRGTTNGNIYISLDEAKILGLVEMDENGEYKITSNRTITESRRWVENHRPQ